MNPAIDSYNQQHQNSNQEILQILAHTIEAALAGAENKIWHARPVWFMKGNPIVGYSVMKEGVRLLFWSGQSFEEEKLSNEGKFKAAGIRYTETTQINYTDLKRWLKKSKKIQWDYKNLLKRKGQLKRLK